jgi:DNA-directed RNA polymerase specialized sigma24 family protein
VLFAESYLVGRPVAEEVVSESFVKFWETRGNFQAIGQIKNWLYTVVRNDCLMVLRHQKVVQKHAEVLSETSSFTETDDAWVAEAELVAIVKERGPAATRPLVSICDLKFCL